MLLSALIQILELFSVAVVIVATVYVLQSSLLRAHILLRFGLAMVCAGSVLELYETLQYIDMAGVHTFAGAIENFGQAIIYTWVATSRRLWQQIGSIGE